MKVNFKVLDISSFQGNLTADAVKKIKAQNMGVILRIGFTGYGSENPTMDANFEANYKALHDAGVPCGAYYFTLCYKEDILIKEINFLKNNLANKLFELPIYLDVEPQTGSYGWTSCSAITRSNNVARICRELQNAGYYMGIYASKSWFGAQLIEGVIKDFDKWVAQYNSKCTYNGKYLMWQYSSKEKASKYGITRTSVVDISNAYCDFPAVIKKARLNGYKNMRCIKCPKCGEEIYIKD